MIRRLLAAAVAAPLLVGAWGAVATASAEPDVVFRFQDPSITESSGLVARDGLVVTVNDSGDSGRVFTVDPATGRTVGVTTWTADGSGPVDVEAVAPVRPSAGLNAVWVGDIGDNNAVRSSITVVRVPVGRGPRTVEATAYELDYPAGPADAETLLVDGDGRLVVVTKGLFGGEVLRAPSRLDPDGANRLERIGSALGIATDGAFFPDGKHLVVRSYGAAVVYTYPGLDEVATLSLPGQEQGEGIAVTEDGEVLLSSEGERSPVLRLPLSKKLDRLVNPPPPPPAEQGPLDGKVLEVPPSTDPDDGSDAPFWPWALGGAVVGAVLVRLARTRTRG